MRANIHLIFIIILTNLVIWVFAWGVIEAVILQMRISSPFIRKTVCVTNPYQCYLRRHPLQIKDTSKDIPFRIL